MTSPLTKNDPFLLTTSEPLCDLVSWIEGWKGESPHHPRRRRAVRHRRSRALSRKRSGADGIMREACNIALQVRRAEASGQTGAPGGPQWLCPLQTARRANSLQAQYELIRRFKSLVGARDNWRAPTSVISVELGCVPDRYC